METTTIITLATPTRPPLLPFTRPSIPSLPSTRPSITSLSFHRATFPGLSSTRPSITRVLLVILKVHLNSKKDTRPIIEVSAAGRFTGGGQEAVLLKATPGEASPKNKRTSSRRTIGAFLFVHLGTWSRKR